MADQVRVSNARGDQQRRPRRQRAEYDSEEEFQVSSRDHHAVKREKAEHKNAITQWRTNYEESEAEDVKLLQENKKLRTQKTKLETQVQKSDQKSRLLEDQLRNSEQKSRHLEDQLRKVEKVNQQLEEAWERDTVFWKSELKREQKRTKAALDDGKQLREDMGDLRFIARKYEKEKKDAERNYESLGSDYDWLFQKYVQIELEKETLSKKKDETVGKLAILNAELDELRALVDCQEALRETGASEVFAEREAESATRSESPPDVLSKPIDATEPETSTAPNVTSPSLMQTEILPSSAPLPTAMPLTRTRHVIAQSSRAAPPSTSRMDTIERTLRELEQEDINVSRLRNPETMAELARGPEDVEERLVQSRGREVEKNVKPLPMKRLEKHFRRQEEKSGRAVV